MGKMQLGIRMKENYENSYRIKLPRRCPVIIRVDGKAFHTYTKGLDRPFDIGFMADMIETADLAMQNMQNCVLAYTQSDEMSFLFNDYSEIETQAWFGNNLQKMCSISASIVTGIFNRLREIRKITRDDIPFQGIIPLFDSRVFIIPDPEEVVNYFIWRQKDAIRNSQRMLAQSLFSAKQLHGKSNEEALLMCLEKGHDWAGLNAKEQCGTFIFGDKDYRSPILTEELNRDLIRDLI